ncbi:MAG: hypothetical protein GXP27_19200 [Planctomycetes bacterium]|nr:hypothetical protein [Planctomycetota bacterium]
MARGIVPVLTVFFCAVLAAAGCTIPPGANVQTSGVGLRAEPLGSAPQAPKLAIGSFSSSYSLPAPVDAGPTLNRVGVQVRGLSIDHTATIAQGPIGEQIQAAGPHLTEALQALHGDRAGAAESEAETRLGWPAVDEGFRPRTADDERFESPREMP